MSVNINNQGLMINLFMVIVGFSVSYPSLSNQNGDHYARYDVKLDRTLETLATEVCFYKDPPPFLEAHDKDAQRRLVLLQGNGKESWYRKLRNDRISLKDMEEGDCLNYTTNIQSSSRHDRRSWFRQQNLTDDNVRISVQSWLWLPRKSEVDGDIVIRFHHDEDHAVSTSWPLLSRNRTTTVYTLGNTPYSWNSYTVLGNIHVELIELPGSQLQLAVMNGEPAANYADIKKWVKHGAEAVTLVYGSFPLPSPQVVVIPVGNSRRDAVMFGHVLRGGGSASHLYIDQTRPIDEHIHDWTLTHELSHMMHPYLGDKGSWIAEGLASYYQNVLQARIGTITHERAWQKLHEGFERGIKQTYEGITLEDAASNRDRSGTMRIYWSGAAIALLADIELRQRGTSLDHILSAFRSCCLPATERWTPLEFMQKLDALSQSNIFLSLYQDHVGSDEFPDLEQVYNVLGIYIREGKVTFTDNVHAAQLRGMIMNRPEIFSYALVQ